MIGLDTSFEELEFVFSSMKTRGNKREVHFCLHDIDMDVTDEEFHPRSPQRSSKKKIIESACHGFSASSLYSLLKHEASDTPSIHSARSI